MTFHKVQSSFKELYFLFYISFPILLRVEVPYLCAKTVRGNCLSWYTNKTHLQNFTV